MTWWLYALAGLAVLLWYLATTFTMIALLTDLAKQRDDWKVKGAAVMALFWPLVFPFMACWTVFFTIKAFKRGG